MHFVAVQCKTFLQEAQMYLNFKQEHIQLFADSCNKERVVGEW